MVNLHDLAHVVERNNDLAVLNAPAIHDFLEREVFAEKTFLRRFQNKLRSVHVHTETFKIIQ
jgi:hypothetical protein